MLFHLPQPTLIFCGPAVWMGMIQAPAVYLNQRILSTLFLPKKLLLSKFRIDPGQWAASPWYLSSFKNSI
jgi:hypothetical protein